MHIWYAGLKLSSGGVWKPTSMRRCFLLPFPILLYEKNHENHEIHEHAAFRVLLLFGGVALWAHDGGSGGARFTIMLLNFLMSQLPV